tara:strand:- start:227 stop:886 length:660 start_codon:yes stop_codon:yes gene_type:complete
MKKSIFGLIILLILLTTYTPKFDPILKSNFNIKKINIENNSILRSEEIRRMIKFLYDDSIFFLNIQQVEESLKRETFIESFSIKKIYPNTLTVIITEKKPIAILLNKKKKFYVSSKGDIINFKHLEKYKNLPTVFGNGKKFYYLYKDLESIKFPIEKIKSYYFFQSGRWDLIMYDDKVIKLPTKNYLFSLKNFMQSKKTSNFNNYKIFDYRIKDQLILN